MLGTILEIEVFCTASVDAHVAITAAFDEVARGESLLSAFLDSSEVCLINRLPVNTRFVVSQTHCDLLRICKNIFCSSQGVFDVVWPSLGECGSAPSFYDIKIDFDSGALSLRRPLRLDFGGIGKGFLVDCAVGVLQSFGIKTGLVSAGGDLRVFGERDFPLHLRSPSNPRTFLQPLNISNCAVATSANYFREKDWVENSAIQDRRTLREWDADNSLSVFAASCAVADALTKVLALAPSIAEAVFLEFGAFGIILTPGSDAIGRVGSSLPCEALSI